MTNDLHKQQNKKVADGNSKENWNNLITVLVELIGAAIFIFAIWYFKK